MKNGREKQSSSHTLRRPTLAPSASQASPQATKVRVSENRSAPTRQINPLLRSPLVPPEYRTSGKPKPLIPSHDLLSPPPKSSVFADLSDSDDEGENELVTTEAARYLSTSF